MSIHDVITEAQHALTKAEHAPWNVDTLRSLERALRRALLVLEAEPLKMQYGIFREQGVTMEGPAYVQIVASTFTSESEARKAAARIPRLKGTHTVIRRRLATGWENLDGEG